MPNSTDDFSNNTLTTGLIAVGTPRLGMIETALDVDWFRIDLSAGLTYRINLDAVGMMSALMIGIPPPPPPTLDPFLRGIYDLNGVLINNTHNDDFNGFNSQVTFTPSTSATYFIAAGAYAQTTGEYNLSVALQATIPPPAPPVTADDFAASIDTTGVITVNSSANGRIETAQDNDWFRVELTAGRSYRINLDGSSSNGSALSDTLIRGIYNQQGVYIQNTTNDDFNGLNSQLTITPSASGVYYIAAAGYSNNVGGYRLSLTESENAPAPSPLPAPTPSPGATDDFAANINTTGAVAVNSSVNGRIETARDGDWFSIELTQGHTYRVNLDGSSTNGHALSDPLIRGIYNQQGGYISNTTNDDFSGRNAQVTFTARSSGTFYIAAEGYDTRTGDYRLSVTDTTPASVIDDYSNTTATTGRLMLNTENRGVLETNTDADWFRAELVAGQHYRINMSGDNYRPFVPPPGMNGPTVMVPYRSPFELMLYSSNGEPDTSVVSQIEESGPANFLFESYSYLEFTPSLSGTYFIEATSDGRYHGNYDLRMITLPSAQDLLDNNNMYSLLGDNSNNTVTPSSNFIVDSTAQRITALAEQLNAASIV